MVDRILDCRGDDDDEKEYLVKWKELPYDESNWELESDISMFQAEIARFNLFQSRSRKISYSKQKSSVNDDAELIKQQKEFQQEYEFYFPEKNKKNKSKKIVTTRKLESIKFDVLLTSYEMIIVDTAVLNPIKWECMNLHDNISYAFRMNLDELFMLMHFLDAGRLITRGTVEERMMEITKNKMSFKHFVVVGMKGQNINQEMLDDIIRHGSKELFADENDVVEKSRQIHYDDAAIDKTLWTLKMKMDFLKPLKFKTDIKRDVLKKTKDAMEAALSTTDEEKKISFEGREVGGCGRRRHMPCWPAIF
ncbi:CHD3-type chromatin-remodeling factor pickle-like protein [Trifolium pratense]|uniref:CHD3-type chromatin-remodeling factor pickle-like protein n=1 Tax=Trifolium pratense TaxID=57577 RepID=A0A2K3NED4_TRIPR|nr:CHD3-type chromatin-remodeling factor pickle-like protein [Trifolium pratense]